MPPRPSNVVNLKTLLTAARQTVNRVVCDKIEFFVISSGRSLQNRLLWNPNKLSGVGI